MSGLTVESAAEIRFQPRVSAGVEYTDNVFLTHKDTEEDFIYSVSPGMTLSLVGRHTELSLSYDPSYAHYEKETRDDYWQHAANGRLFTQLSRTANFQVSHTYLRTENLFSDEDYTLRRGQAPYDRHTTSASYVQEFGRDNQFSLSYTHSFLENEDPTLEDSATMSPAAEIIYWFGPRWGIEAKAVYRQTDYDTSEDFYNWSGTMQVNRRFSRHLTSFVNFGYTAQTYDENSEDFDVYDMGAGFTYDIDSTSTLQMAVNYFIRDYDDGKNVDGVPVTIDYTKQFKRGRMGISTGGGYETTSATAENLGFYTYYFARIDGQYDFYERLYGGIDLMARRIEYQDQSPEFKDDIGRARAYVAYRLFTWLSVQLEYNLRAVESELHSRDYVENSGMLRFTATTPQPFRM